MASTFRLNEILSKIYGVTALPFPGNPQKGNYGNYAAPFTAPVQAGKERSTLGTPLWGTNNLGRPVFLPAKLDGVDLPNPLITISGAKQIKQTDIIDVGSVFEKVFTLPYDITIVSVLIGTIYDDGNEMIDGAAMIDAFPESQIIQMKDHFIKDRVLTLECALTDIFLQSKDNFVISSINFSDMQGTENVQIVQINGKSNIDFELEII